VATDQVVEIVVQEVIDPRRRFSGKPAFGQPLDGFVELFLGATVCVTAAAETAQVAVEARADMP
jgi:hypothetical protein